MHPLGQTLIVTVGLGWVQREGGPIEEIRPGDVVWFPPGEKHWHGATPTTALTHIAIQEKKDGKVVDWMEKSAMNNTVNENETPRTSSFPNPCHGSHFRPNRIGSVSMSFRDLTMPRVSALYFLKCGACRCDSYAASSLYVSKILT